MKQSTYRVLILMLLLSSTLALLFSLGGNYWMKTTEMNQGLWKECKPNGDCQDVSHAFDFVLHIVRFAIIGGLGFLLVSTCYFIAMTVSPKSFRSLYLSGFIGLAAIFIISGVSVYTYFNTDRLTDHVAFHWSYWLCWFAASLTIATTGFTCYDSRRPATPYEHAIRLD